jgi:hypothetical protein
MSRAALSLALALFLASIPPAELHADAPAGDPPAPSVHCVPGPAGQCFAVAFLTSGQTFTLWLQNLEGSAAAGTASAPFNVDAVMITRVNPTEATGAVTEQLIWAPDDTTGLTVGDVQLGGEIFGEASYAEDGDELLQTRLEFVEGPFGILGCTAPALLPGTYVARMCLEEGLDGWYVLGFETGIQLLDPIGRRDLVLDDVTIRVNDCVVWVGASSGTGATSNCFVTTDYAGFVAVPEPATGVLAAGGLLALGAGRAWRRRRSVANARRSHGD